MVSVNDTIKQFGTRNITSMRAEKRHQEAMRLKFEYVCYRYICMVLKRNLCYVFIYVQIS